MSHDVMFISTPNNQVIAIDAKSGNVLWRYRRPRPADGPRAGDGQGVHRASIDEVNDAHKPFTSTSTDFRFCHTPARFQIPRA
jgi:glucose dehydrogenase